MTFHFPPHITNAAALRHSIIEFCILSEPPRQRLMGAHHINWGPQPTFFLPALWAGVKRELLDTVKARKLAYYGHSMRKQGSCLEKEIMQRTMPGARRRGRPRTAWVDNIKTWTGLSVDESIKMREDRNERRR